MLVNGLTAQNATSVEPCSNQEFIEPPAARVAGYLADLREVPLKQHLSESELIKFAHVWPKFDLHCHLEGAISCSMLDEVITDFNLEVPTDELDVYRQGKPSDSLVEFLTKFQPIQSVLQSYEILHRLVRDIIADAASQNLLHLELRFSPFFIAEQHGLDPKEVIRTIESAVVSNQGGDISRAPNISLIIIADRHRGPEHAAQVARMACECTAVGFDLASDEANFPAHLFTEAFDIARAGGKQLTCHAGEAAGAESVRDAIELLGVSRIGHGVRVMESPEVMQLARDRGIIFEVCPISNIHTGTVASMQEHPMLDMRAQGLQVTLNTDDPGICNDTFSGELLNAIKSFNLSCIDVIELGHAALKGLFVEEDIRRKLQHSFEQRSHRVWEEVNQI